MLYAPLDGRTVAGDFVIAEWREGACPADGPMWVAPLHRHHVCDEAFYVLEGRLAFLIDGQETIAEAGSLLWVPKGSSHTYWNPDAREVRYLLIMTPKTQALIEAIHSAEDRSTEKMKALFACFDAEFIGF